MPAVPRRFFRSLWGTEGPPPVFVVIDEGAFYLRSPQQAGQKLQHRPYNEPKAITLQNRWHMPLTRQVLI